jgi:shikimate kinase
VNEKIYLTGFMGSGKTTVGQALGKAIGYQVIDTDQWIEQTYRTSISTIFEEKGESYFRSLETEALRNLLNKRAIITTGGGIVVREENRQIMKQSGKVIFLDCEIEEVIRRTSMDHSRPLLKQKNKEQISAMFKERLPFYREADIQIDTTGKSILSLVEELKSLMLR